MFAGVQLGLGPVTCEMDPADAASTVTALDGQCVVELSATHSADFSTVVLTIASGVQNDHVFINVWSISSISIEPFHTTQGTTLKRTVPSSVAAAVCPSERCALVRLCKRFGSLTEM